MTHDDLFQTLADPTRRRVVMALRHGERSVSELVEAVDIHQSGVSRHLSILAASGFVEVRRDGARRLYRLRPWPFRELQAWLGRFQGVWERRTYKRVTRRASPR
jgi:DNA-binding transcriptional ArsR family regulator